MKKSIYLLIAGLTITAPLVAQPPTQKDTAWKAIYRETSPRINNLVHTKLDVRFDYAKKHMYGKAWITLQPHFYATDSLLLDAKGMEIKKVAVVKGSAMKDLTYTYNKKQIRITLDKNYKQTEKYIIYIDYIAKPDELEGAEGSAAISGAKGLYFINPDGSEKDKPIQIWTQGETEATSVWCPTIDRPNQKTTQEISMTVPQKYVTLSNGLMVSQKKNSDGTRTDNWKMDLPHAPYLFFMGVGEFAIVKDAYKGKEVSYYVEKAYEPVARKIFGNTPEMMTFFSRITGVDFPWSKYAQIVCRDYVSGAMENTTATIHQETAQQDARQLLDGNSWEDVIAHELFHQWFGDYVTSESWSNLTLNESFADYSEYLWNEYKYGKDKADEHNYQSMMGYVGGGTANATKDLVRFKYSEQEDMFDGVSYAKGGRILNMLRTFVGDSAFFKALNVYLTSNKFKSAEAHQLRLAFEEVTGKDLNWFWNQWYFGAGHPKVSIDYTYDEANKQVTVSVKQTQKMDKVFRLPMLVDVYNGNKKVSYPIVVDSKEQSFTFPYTTKPDLVNVDASKATLWEKTDNKSLENYIHQYTYAGNYLDRREAIDFCLKNQDQKPARDLLIKAMNDRFSGLRSMAIKRIKTDKGEAEAIEAALLNIAKTDKHRPTRADAIEALGKLKKNTYADLFKAAAMDSSYTLAGSAIRALKAIDLPGAKALSAKLAPGSKGLLKTAVSEIVFDGATDDDFTTLYQMFNTEGLQGQFNMLPRFIGYMGKVNNTVNFKKGIEAVLDLTKKVPEQFQDQVTEFLNSQFESILKKKEEGKAANPALQEHIDFINAKMVKKGF
jgi:aminopeptidase N